MIPQLLIGGAAIVAWGGLAIRRNQRRQVNQQIQNLHVGLQQRYLTLADQLSTTAREVDDNYQQFMVDKIDPFFGRERSTHLAEMVASEEKLEISEYEKQLNRYIAAAVTTMGLAAAAHLVNPLLIIPAIGTALYSTTLIFRNGYDAIVKEKKLRMDVMGSLYFICTWAGGYFLAGGIGLVAFYLSEKLVFITQDRSQKGLIKIFGQQPRTIWQLIDGLEIEVPFESLNAGDTVVVHAGQVIAIDGIIVHGMATVDQHMLTGEAQPVEKGVGDPVLASTVLLAGNIHVQVEKTGEATVAAQIGTILNNTASYQAGIVSKGEQVADRSVPPSLLLALVALPLSGYKFMVTILGSAIGLNIKITAPIAMLNFLNLAAKHGILIKDGRSLELLKSVDTVVFDKTGTLTLEQPHVTAIHPWGETTEEQLLIYAAAAEHRQTHPVARAILAAAAEQGLTLPMIDHAQYEIGYGIRVQVGEKTILVGSDRYMTAEAITIPEEIRTLQANAQQQGHSVVMVAVDQQLAGAIELQPTLRPEAKAIVEALRARKLELYIISGDNEQPTRKMANDLGITNFFANTLPENKAALVEQLQKEGRAVCFVGDGINDSIALKKANVSISLRGASSAATDSAQVILMAQSLQQLPYVFDLSEKFDSNMKAGFTAAIGQGVIVIAGALLGRVGILTGTLIWEIGLLAGLGIATLPILQERNREA